MPPNCILEVDDITKAGLIRDPNNHKLLTLPFQPFTYEQKFDLIHIRMLAGSLSTEQWHQLYQRCYDALTPGGWIEHYDVGSRGPSHSTNSMLILSCSL